jgi:hypothetical protein
VNTDWLTDAFTRGGSLWDTNYTSCRRGVPSGTLICDLPYANTRVIIVWLPVNTNWLTDAFTRGGTLWDTNYTSFRHGVPSRTEATLLACRLFQGTPLTSQVLDVSSRTKKLASACWFSRCTTVLWLYLVTLRHLPSPNVAYRNWKWTNITQLTSNHCNAKWCTKTTKILTFAWTMVVDHKTLPFGFVWTSSPH